MYQLVEAMYQIIKSPPIKRKLFGTPLTTKNAIKCWKCGELGHTSKAHYDASNAHYSGDRPPGKPMAVNACATQNLATAENAQAQDAVQINRCAVLEPRTECVGLGVDSPEGPSLNFIPEGCEGRDSSECGNTVSLDSESVVMTCKSVAGMSSLIPPLNYVSVDLEGSERTYKSMLDCGAMMAVAKSSLIPQELRELVGETTLQGAFGECVNAELSMLKIRLHQEGAESVYIPILFALTDALASKECDMLLPAHA